jgi:hypothetical protein
MVAIDAIKVNPRGCDFFDFSQKPSLKTLRLDAKNSRILNKVTSSENEWRYGVQHSLHARWMISRDTKLPQADGHSCVCD